MERLQQIGDEIWIADGPVVDFHSFPYPTRMVVVRLAGRRLWVWSPIALDPPLRAEVESLGDCAHLVSPNKLHHLFLAQWAAAWPNAEIWVPKGIPEKRPDLAAAHLLGDDAPAAWEGEIEQVVFRGSPLMEEVVFFHRRSRTAIFADLIENFSEEFLRSQPGWGGWRRALAHLSRITEPYGMAPLDWRLSWFGRTAARRALATVLAWNPERVVMAHGTWVPGSGRVFIERSFRWLK
jgi:hypothetical protein